MVMERSSSASVVGPAVGYSGLVRYNGMILDEWLPDLRGSRGLRVIREMTDNDPTIGAILFAIEMRIRQVEWQIAAHPDAPANDPRTQFLTEALEDMEVTWPDRLSEILSMLSYGWAYHELLYKRRDGKESKYSDGLIGWRDWSLRGQETLQRWEFDSEGRILGMWQQGAPTYEEVFVPYEKALLFRTSVRRGSPEGKSILRSAYRAWFFKKQVEVFEGIGLERDLAGIPLLTVPAEILEQDNEVLRSYKDTVTSVKVNENQGMILPSDLWDGTSTPMYSFELVRASGQKQFDTGAIIGRYDLRIAQTVLADFIHLGHEATGSRALSQDKTDMFAAAIGAWLHTIAAVVNDTAIPRLLRLNGLSTDNAPTLEHGDIEATDLAELGQYILNLDQAHMPLDRTPGGPLAQTLMQRGRMPDQPEDATASAPAAPIPAAPSVPVPTPVPQQATEPKPAQTSEQEYEAALAGLGENLTGVLFPDGVPEHD
jgi:hypothetical protein